MASLNVSENPFGLARWQQSVIVKEGFFASHFVPCRRSSGLSRNSSGVFDRDL